MKEDTTQHSEPLAASRKDRRKALTSVNKKSALVLKVVDNRFQKLALAASQENVEMNDDQIAMFLDNKMEETFPLTQKAFNEFKEARKALTFLSVSRKSIKEMQGLPQFRKDDVQTKKEENDIPNG